MQNYNFAPKIQELDKSEIGNLIPIPVGLIKEIYFIIFNFQSKADPDCWKPFVNKSNRINIEEFLIYYLGTDPIFWASEIPKEKYFFNGIDSKGNYDSQLTKKSEWINGLQKRSPKIVSDEFISCFRPFRAESLALTGEEDIHECLKQYNNDKFLFCGFVLPDIKYNPNDFKLPNPIPKVDNLGFVLNTNAKDGSHWVALFIHFQKSIQIIDNVKKEYTILKAEYFDSLGGQIPTSLINSISKLYGTIKLKFRHFDGEPITKRSNIQLQKVGLDCGVYAVHFIVTRLKQSKVSMEDFLQTDAPDDQFMKKCKSFYWNIYKPNLKEFLME